jgi:hypothetical protein
MKDGRGRVEGWEAHMAKPGKGLAGRFHPLIMAYYGIGVGRCPPPTADSEKKGERSL